jgi:hypothetical protein
VRLLAASSPGSSESVFYPGWELGLTALTEIAVRALRSSRPRLLSCAGQGRPVCWSGFPGLQPDRDCGARLGQAGAAGCRCQPSGSRCCRRPSKRSRLRASADRSNSGASSDRYASRPSQQNVINAPLIVPGSMFRRFTWQPYHPGHWPTYCLGGISGDRRLPANQQVRRRFDCA